MSIIIGNLTFFISFSLFLIFTALSLSEPAMVCIILSVFAQQYVCGKDDGA